MRAVVMGLWVAGCGSETPVGPGPGDDDDTVPVTTDTGTPVLPSIAVVINELMADNDSTVNGPDGLSFPDWVELVNVGDVPVAWSRLGLRNDDGTLWEGVDGELAPGERAVLWADDALELGFGLNKDGDKLTLLGDGEVLDYVDFDEQAEDIALARIPDLTGDRVATAWATPGEPNGDLPSPTLEPADETVFTDTVVHQIEFTFTEQAFHQIDQWERPEVHVEMAIDGVGYPDIGLALKGSASYDNMNGKPAFSVDLNQWVLDTKFRGLKAFKLHNGNVYDPTRIHDYLTYQLARESGLMGPRVGWAEVYCNGQYYGIYMVIEKADDELIGYHHPDQEEIGVILEPNEGFYDFGSGGSLSQSVILSAWDEGPLPPDPLVIEALQAIDDIVSRTATDENLTEFWVHVDKEAFLAYLAWETLVMHTDGYRSPNNWRVFVNGATYQAQWVPAGAEWTWDSQVEAFPSWGGLAMQFCFANAGCRREYAEQVLLMADRVEALDLATQFEDLSLWLDPIIQSDPRYNPLWGSVGTARESSRERLAENPGRARDQVYAMFPDLQP